MSRAVDCYLLFFKLFCFYLNYSRCCCFVHPYRTVKQPLVIVLFSVLLCPIILVSKQVLVVIIGSSLIIAYRFRASFISSKSASSCASVSNRAKIIVAPFAACKDYITILVCVGKLAVDCVHRSKYFRYHILQILIVVNFFFDAAKLLQIFEMCKFYSGKMQDFSKMQSKVCKFYRYFALNYKIPR